MKIILLNIGERNFFFGVNRLRNFSHIDFDFRPDFSDEFERRIEDLVSDFDVFGQRHRSKLGLVQVGVQPGCQQTQVWQRGGHPDDLDVETFGPMSG